MTAPDDFGTYVRLADELIDKATKDQLADVARLLALNIGFLHPNSKRMIALLQFLLGMDPSRALAWLKPRPRLACPCCGAEIKIAKTRISPALPASTPMPLGNGIGAALM